jgi:3-oxoacyl-[acyl-carrier-protein] synthase-1
MGPQRLIELVTAALSEAALAASVRAMLPDDLRLFLALPNPRPGFDLSDASSVARGVETAKFPKRTALVVTPVVGGHAGAIKALELAIKCIIEGTADLCLIGGVDSHLDAIAIASLESDRRLSRAGVRGGFVPGEAAAVVVVASQAGYTRLGLRPLAHIRGVATGLEPRLIDSDEGLLGEGLTDVIKRASQNLRLPEERVENIYCDINGERHRTDEWAFTVMRAWNLFRDGTCYTTNVGSWGDIGAASAAVSCVLAVEGWRRRYAEGRRSLVWASSVEGLRGAVILEQAGS